VAPSKASRSAVNTAASHKRTKKTEQRELVLTEGHRRYDSTELVGFSGGVLFSKRPGLGHDQVQVKGEQRVGK
jgi:hypothetical protein